MHSKYLSYNNCLINYKEINASTEKEERLRFKNGIQKKKTFQNELTVTIFDI